MEWSCQTVYVFYSVDVPIQMYQVAVEAEESEEDDIEELTVSEFAIQGLAQDFR